jgi:hypothetical protein
VPKLIVAIGVAGLLAGCGGSSAPASRYSPTYPENFVATFTHSCSTAHGSTAMCQCALKGTETAVDYVTLIRDAPAITNAAPPAWWNSMQIACKRRGPGSPPYVAPRAFDFLLPPAPPAAQVQQAVVPLIDACINHAFGSTAPPPAAATRGTNTLIRLAQTYSLTAPLRASIGKITTLHKALVLKQALGG